LNDPHVVELRYRVETADDLVFEIPPPIGDETEAFRIILEHLKGPWSKLEAYLVRLSLILALVRTVEEHDTWADWLGKGVTEPDVRAAADLLGYFKAHARKVYAKLHGENPHNLLGAALKDFLREQAGRRWEGMTHDHYGIVGARSVLGLPGGPVPFGKMIRRICERDDELTLNGGWEGKKPILKLSLSAPDSAVHEGGMDTDAEGTDGKTGAEGANTGREVAEEPVMGPASPPGPAPGRPR